MDKWIQNDKQLGGEKKENRSKENEVYTVRIKDAIEFLRERA